MNAKLKERTSTLLRGVLDQAADDPHLNRMN
jgi:hypothetical protein